MNLAPHNPEAEAGIVGAALLAPSIVRRLIAEEALTPGHFWVPDFQKAWQAIVDLYDQGTSVDTVAVARRMQTPNATDTLESALACASSANSIRSHAQIVKHDAMRRGWQQAGYMLIDAADEDDEQLVAQAEQQLRAPTVTEDSHSTDSVGAQVFDWIADRNPVGISSGFPALDKQIGGGLRPGDMTALGAWTGIGKSALCDQILTEAALTGRRCHAYINEMSVTDRALRMIARSTPVPFSKLVTRDLDNKQVEYAIKASAKIPFGLTDCSQWTADQVARHIRANAWDLCALDLVHNMPYERESELHRIVATLAAAARSSRAHLILVCHFNEARATTDTLPRPVARDIRGSGMIKNLSANVLLLHREQHSEGGFITTLNTGALLVDKARHGQKGGVNVEFDPDRMKFWPAVTTTPIREAA